MNSRLSIYALPALGLLFCPVNSALAQGWGDIKGQVIFTGPAIPPVKNVNVNKDAQHCLAKGPIADDSVVIDGKTKGVKNVMVWLAPLPAGPRLPIHPALVAVPQQKVVIDQPCCMFVPRITMMREGQTLEIKNPAPVLHNAKIIGSQLINGTFNLAIPPGGSIERSVANRNALRAEKKPMLLGCDVHGWMGGRIGVFDHPYFTLTKEDGTFEIKNAPAGRFKVFVLQEKVGWLHTAPPGGRPSDGQDITIRAGANDLGKIGMP